MMVLGIDIPDELMTPTIKNTDWTPEPIRSMRDINPKWIGGKSSQVSARVVEMMWGIDTEIGLLKNRAYWRDSVLGVINDKDPLSFTDAETKAKKQHLLGYLRGLFLVDCLLANRNR